jgi:hypothetical protein
MSTVLETPGSTAVETPASPAGTGVPAVPAAPPAAGSAAAPPAASPESQNIRQLREQYEALKTKVEPWEKIGADPKDVASNYQIISGMRKEALELGEQLGYDAEEVKEFFGKDPVQVLNHLRQKAAAPQPTMLSPVEQRKQFEKLAQEALKPITQREEARATKEAEFRFTGEFDRLYKETFKDGLPDDCKDAILRLTADAVGADADACRRLKIDGQVSDVARHFTAAKDNFLKIVNSYIAHERKRTGGGGNEPQAPGQPAAKPKSAMDVVLKTGQSVRELFNQ